MLESKLARSERGFREALTLSKNEARQRRRHLMEGALSDAWQAYCAFVRSVVIRSATGCTTASGNLYPASVAPASWQRVSYIAAQAARNKNIQAGGLNSVLRIEPTWGDSNKIVLILNALNPGNRTTLLGRLSGGLNGPKHCQIVRNACAHINHQTKAEVESLAIFYSASRVRHPTDALEWRDPNTQEFAFIAWLEDMRVIGQGAIL